MTPHVDDGLLQDFQEGLLPPEVEEEVRRHLAECSRCRRELETLADLLDAMAELPQEVQPSRDLWPQVAWRITGEQASAADAGAGGAEVDQVAEWGGVSRGYGVGGGSLAEDRFGARRLRGRRINLAAWQLLAASLVVALVSGASVWAFLSGRGGEEGPMTVPAPWIAQQAVLDQAYGGYDEAVADLESALEQGRHVLGPETVLVLEENLAIIDQAIQEAREALALDPGSAVVRRILAENLRWKVSLLRHAVSAVYTNT
jgi:tetratricopeptide (TPR) repeat protein